MSYLNPEHEFSPQFRENEKLTFADKFGDLLAGMEFDEPVEMLEARTAVLEALTRNGQNPEFLRSVWMHYNDVCEQAVDSRSDADPQIRAQLQIAVLVHKALIFREIRDIQRYGEDLSDAEAYALNMHFDEIAEAIGVELDNLAS